MFGICLNLVSVFLFFPFFPSWIYQLVFMVNGMISFTSKRGVQIIDSLEGNSPNNMVISNIYMSQKYV